MGGDRRRLGKPDPPPKPNPHLGPPARLNLDWASEGWGAKASVRSRIQPNDAGIKRIQAAQAAAAAGEPPPDVALSPDELEVAYWITLAMIELQPSIAAPDGSLPQTLTWVTRLYAEPLTVVLARSRSVVHGPPTDHAGSPLTPELAAAVTEPPPSDTDA